MGDRRAGVLVHVEIPLASHSPHGDHVKFSIFAGAAASVALIASTASAQTCQGELSFRSGSTHVGGALGISNNTTAFGGALTFGHIQGLFGGGSLGMTSYSGVSGNSFDLGGGIGYAMPLANRSVWQLCPAASLNLGFGPSETVGGTTVHASQQTFTLGASVGRALPLSRSITLLPFGSVALGHTTLSASANGVSASQSDGYLLLGFGAGFQISPNLVLRPALNLAAGADLVDDTVFSFGVTFALPR
jgi:hypothetical protein